MGAGPLPRVEPTDHPPRPPIPIVAVDEEAMVAARRRGEGDLAVWLAGVTGAQRPVPGVRRVGASSILRRSPAPGRDEAGAERALTVAEVAAAVDAGRDVAAAAADEGITVLVASAAAADDPTPALSLIATLAGRDPRPLRSLRRIGTEEIAALCGVALGAGEHGLGCVCEGLAALAGAAVAAAIEPTLLPRLRAVGEGDLAARLGIGVVDAQDLAAALD